MKEKTAGRTRLNVIRMARAAIQNKEIEVGHELPDEEVLEIIAREVRMRSESLPTYEKSGRKELVAQLREEIAILGGYLPEQLSVADIEELVRESIARLGASGPRDLGRVMKETIPKTKGRAGGKMVNQVVRRLLEEL